MKQEDVFRRSESFLPTIVVKEILASTHRMSDLKVICNDSVRFAVYEEDGRYKVYLLNTDFDFEMKAKVLYNEEEIETVIPSGGIEMVEIRKNDLTVDG